MLPGSRAWDESHSRSSPRASAELHTLRQRRKEKFRKRGDQPRSDAAKKDTGRNRRSMRTTRDRTESRTAPAFAALSHFQTMSLSCLGENVGLRAESHILLGRPHVLPLRLAQRTSTLENSSDAQHRNRLELGPLLTGGVKSGRRNSAEYSCASGAVGNAAPNTKLQLRRMALPGRSSAHCSLENSPSTPSCTH